MSPFTEDMMRMAVQFPATSCDPFQFSIAPVVGVSQELLSAPITFQVTVALDNIAMLLFDAPLPSNQIPESVPELLQQGRFVNWL
jgi:hypothetical protein